MKAIEDKLLGIQKTAISSDFSMDKAKLMIEKPTIFKIAKAYFYCNLESVEKPEERIFQRITGTSSSHAYSRACR